MATKILESINSKLKNLEKRAEKAAEKKVRYERIMEMARTMNLFEKLELHIKIGL